MIKTRVKGQSGFRALSTDFDKTKYLGVHGEYSTKAVADILNKPVSTIRHWMERDHPPGRRGTKSYLTPSEDAKLAEIVNNKALEMAAVSRKDLAALVSHNGRLKFHPCDQQPLQAFAVACERDQDRPSAPPSESWTKGWRKRHPGFHFKHGQQLEPERIQACNVVNIEDWIRTMDNELQPGRWVDTVSLHMQDVVGQI